MRRSMRQFLGMTTALSIGIVATAPVHGQNVLQTAARVQVERVAEAASGVKPASASPGLFSCAAPGSKQIIGAAGGGVVGGLLGNRVVGGNRSVGTVVGGAVGAAAGSWLGCKLQINDRRKAEAALARAASEGKPQQWSSTDTGASGSAVPIGSSSLNGLRFPSGIEPQTAYDSRAGSFRALKNVNLRTSPSIDAPIISTVAKGASLNVAAGAANTNWLLVADGGVARGYVMESLLDRQAASPNSHCQRIRQTITSRADGSQSEDYQACPDGSGGWQINRL